MKVLNAKSLLFFISLVSFAANAEPVRDASFIPHANEAKQSPVSLVPPAENPVSAQPVPPAPQQSEPVDLGKPVSSEELENVDPDAMGILTSSNGGLGASMWNGTPRVLVDALMPQMSLPTTSSALNGLARKLFLTAAAVPIGESKSKTSLTSMRLEKLLALGDVEDAWKLALLAQPGHVDEITMRLITEAELIGPESKAICDKMPEIMAARNKPDNPAIEWQKALILCQLRAGDAKAAQLGMDLMAEQQVKDDIFLTLVNRNVLGNGKRLPRNLTPLKTLNLALLRQTDIPLPPELYARPDAHLVPELLKAKTEDENARIALAERAATQGIIGARQLEEVYSTAVIDVSQATRILSGEEGRFKQRAALYQALGKEQQPDKIIETVGKFVSSSDLSFLTGAGGQMLYAFTDKVQPANELSRFAPLAALINALAGKPDKASAWLKIAKSAASSAPEIASAVNEYWPLYVLSGLISDAEYGKEIKAWLDYMLKNPDRAQKQKAGNLLMYFSAVGFSVPDEAFVRVSDFSFEGKKMLVPSPVLHDRMGLSGTSKRKGETAMLAIMLAGNLSETPVMVIADAVKALRQADMMPEAQTLAREAAAMVLSPQKP